VTQYLTPVLAGRKKEVTNLKEGGLNAKKKMLPIPKNANGSKVPPPKTRGKVGDRRRRLPRAKTGT